MPDKKKTRISLIEDICDYIRNISLPERAMLNTLARYANPDGSSVYPSHELLAIILKTTDRNVRRLISSLQKKGYVLPDGKHGYTKQYRLNIPTIPIISQDISKEEWDKMMQPDLGDDDEPTDKRPAFKPPDNDATVKVPVINPAPATPPVPTLEEKRQSDLAVMGEYLNLVRKGIYTYDGFMKGGRRKGFSDDYLNWMFDTGGEIGYTDSPDTGHQPADEPATANELISDARHQTGMYQS